MFGVEFLAYLDLTKTSLCVKKKTIKYTVKETFFQTTNEFEYIIFFRKFFFCRVLEQFSSTACMHVCVKCSRKWHRIINSEIHTFKDIT